MDADKLINGLISYITLVVLLTFHEFGHAWMAMMCGDDTAKREGRVSLNPLVHIDPIGTVLMPLLQIFLPREIGSFLLGWAKPVPVNPYNLRNPKLDDVLITMAGPWMNLLLAIVCVGVVKIGLMAHSVGVMQFCYQAAIMNLGLFFFNLLPIPPLDGSRLMRVATNMSHETYNQLAQYSYFVIIAVIQLTPVPHWIAFLIGTTLDIISSWFGIS